MVNNAGQGYSMPFTDLDVQKVRDLFELNVFSYISMIQTFVPLLRKSNHGPMILNNTSIAGSFGLAFQTAYR
jgi:short-subunit dehydrogenase